MKLILVLAMLLGGCASQPTSYYPSSYGYSSGYSSSYNSAGPVRTYFLYNNGHITPVLQNGPIIMPLTGFGFR